MAGYIIIGVFGAIFLFILILYMINTKKINKKVQKTKEKEKVEKEKHEKVEVESEITKEKPLDAAIAQANIDYHVKEAFERIEQERIEFEKDSKRGSEGGRLKLDRGDFRTELQKSLETNIISSETNVISSDTAKMDYEISSEKKEEKVDIDKQIAEEHENDKDKSKTLLDEINNLSPEAKSILINDILKKKYE